MKNWREEQRTANKGFCNIGADGSTMNICTSVLLLFGLTGFNWAFCCYLHHQLSNWASVLGGRFSNSPTSQSPVRCTQNLWTPHINKRFMIDFKGLIV